MCKSFYYYSLNFQISASYLLNIDLLYEKIRNYNLGCRLCTYEGDQAHAAFSPRFFLIRQGITHL